MSNRITVTRTVFTDYADGVKSCGYRIYDDYATEYGNLCSEDELKLTDKEFLEAIVPYFSEVGTSIFDYALEIGRITVDNFNYEIVLEDGNWKLK